jgi:hypothetical protein
MSTRQSIRKYGQYHRPIARPVLFWLNGHGGKFHGGYERAYQTHTNERTRGMSKIDSDTTWAKSRARSALDAVPNFGRCGWDALEAKLACHDTEGKLEMKKNQRGIDPASKPSGDGCVECLASPKGWWFHLRRCAKCGHIGCCDSSPSQHASKHAATTGHPIIASFEPGEDWFYDYEKRGMIKGVELLPPHSHPEDQPSPGPAGRVPANWESLLH